jgi:putative transcriptional regulator
MHQCPEMIGDGIEIVDGIFWGGNFEQVIAAIQNKTLKQNLIRFYIGYSGWGEGQLEEELKTGTWLTTEGNRQLIFHKNTDAIWQDALKQKGGEYTQLINYPTDPQLN